MKLYLATFALVMMTAGCNGDVDSDVAPQDPQVGTEANALGGNFFDSFSGYNSSLWTRASWADPWPNNCGWKQDHVSFAGGFMQLLLDNSPSAGRGFSGAELSSNSLFGYGKAETRMIAAKRSGVISSFFTYTGASDGNPWDEIDVEFLGDDTTSVQFNYFKNGNAHHEYIHHLGFDGAAAYHNYAIVWTPNSIKWQVDSQTVHTVWGDPSTLPSHPMHIMMNLWNTTGVDGWAGSFTYPGHSLTAGYDWTQYFANATN